LTLSSAALAASESEPADELVIVLQPSSASPAVCRSLSRIRDELSADRFRVVVPDASVAAEPGSAESALGAPEGSTIVALFGDPDSGQSELWVVARAGRRWAARRAWVAAEDPQRMPELLSARALELVRATALELSLRPEAVTEVRRSPEVQKLPAPGPTVAPADPFPAAGNAFGPSIFDIDLGIGVLHSVAGPPPAVVPIGRIRLHFARLLYGRASFAGLGSRPRVETMYGAASLSQTIGMIELGAVFRRDKRIRPSVSVGAGVLHVIVDGNGNPPYEGREPAHWSAAFDAGLGVAFAIGSHVALATELHAIVANPHPTIRFIDLEPATIGFPALMLTLAIQVAP
jgi:hypothetical protein